MNLVLAWLLATSPAMPNHAVTSGSWEKVYETPRREQWLASVWLNGDGSWRAGGKDLIVSGGAKGVRTTDIAGFDVYAFGEDASGAVVAVGSRQAIWEEQGDGFKRVHERPGPPRKGRAAYKDTLEGVGYLDPARPDRLVAYGSLHLAVTREQNKAWQVTDDDRLAQRGSLGPELKPPPGCHTAGWHWLSRTDGLLDCHEGMAYLYTGATPAPVGRLPIPCGVTMRTAVRDGAELFVACGQKGGIWRHRVGVEGWSEVPRVRDVRALQARGGCLLAATARTVLRRCGEALPGGGK